MKTPQWCPQQAIFCACLALAFGVEIVVFSPARRASRKLLERIVECRRAAFKPPPSRRRPTARRLCTRRFVNLAGGSAKICEYNQEACRINSFDGRKSLVRSFPSKVAVRRGSLKRGNCKGFSKGPAR